MASFTPRAAVTSARKLFPRSPTSDCESDDSLGHMSPLSSPDRYSSPPCTPEGSGGGPGYRTGRSPRTPVRTSPRNSRFDLLKPAVSSPLFVRRDIKRLRKHLDLNNTGELDRSFSKPADVENENTPFKSSTNTVIPQTPSQKSSKFGIVEESPNTPSVGKLSSATTGNAKKTVVALKSVSDPAIPASVFYGKRSLTRELFPVPDPGSGTRRGGLGTAMKARQRYSSVDSLRSTGSNRPARGVARRKSRRVPGEINAGVFHKLRRPKPKKLSAGSAAYKVPRVMPRGKAERYLRSAGLPVELTSFSWQVARGESGTPQKQQAGQGLKRKMLDPPTPPPDPSKKFFKTNRTVHKTKTVTFDGNIKVRVAEGKYSLNRPENPLKFRTRKVLKFKLFSGARSDCVFEAADDDGMEQVNSSVRQLLEDLGDEPGATPDNAGVVVIASAPEQEEAGVVGTSDEVVPGTPQKAQVIAEYVVGANGEIASPGLSFITSSLAISEDRSACSDAPGRSNDSAGLAVVNPEGPPEQDLAGVSGEAVASLQPGNEVVAANVTLEPSGNECFVEHEKKDSAKKFFPLFYKSPERVKNVLLDTTNKKTLQPGRRAPWRYGGGDDQFQIDAGQKRLGATQCSECGLVYSEGDMDDELAHLGHHNSTRALRFLGWRHERLVATHGAGRVVVVHPGDSKSWWKKVAEVLEVVDRDLGYADGGSGLDIQGSKVFLYVESRSVVGCLVAQPVAEAHRLQVTAGLDTCSRETFPVKCGVSRLWVAVSRRRRGVASRLVDCMRANFMYGYILGVEDFAFSVPTVSGKEFGMKYTNKQNFLVYV